MSDTAIKIEGVHKDFKISHERSTTLKSHFTSILKGKKSRTIETQHALKDISFEIKKGEFFGIVGRNGSGKSTLLKMLAGIYQPTKGNIHVEGKLVPFIELGVGFNPELTGRENVYLNGALLGFSEQEVAAFYDEVVEFAELEQFMDKKLKNYSSGMQVRLAFSMAVQSKADILLIDEVLAVGDADFQRKCFEYFNFLKKVKTTVVFVSHDMEAVRRYCDRAILIEDSELVKSGKPELVTHAYIQQFSQGTDDMPELESHGDNRWGDQNVVVESITTSVTEKEVIITETLHANKGMDEFVVGVRIRTSAGEDVTGTNTALERKKIPPLKSKEKITVEWRVPNIFSDGVYVVDPAIHHQDGITVSDWWQEATRFSVRKERKLPYLTDPGFKIDIK